MKKILGIELGSTRIKSVLINEKGEVLAQGGFEWENKLENGFWTYDLEDAIIGLKASYKSLLDNYGNKITKLDAIGVSGMMHGYLAFDKNWKLLTPFRTWRNTCTLEASTKLTNELDFNIPQRWTSAHFYQAVLNGEKHVGSVAHLTTLAGYIHKLLTGENVIGLDEASGIFPIDGDNYNYDALQKYNQLLRDKGITEKAENLFPKVLSAGENAGVLTKEGAKLLDQTGALKAGAILCPPEGDAGTGMVATNAVNKGQGNVSAGTSGFLMAVMERPLSKVYPEIDVIATPDGKPVAMVHVNNFTCDINSWTGVFNEVLNLFGVSVNKGELFDKLFKKSLESDQDVGDISAYNFLSGEHIVGVNNGAPTLIKSPKGDFNLANFMQSVIYSAISGLAIGMEILEKENVKIDSICGHGGFFKTEFVGANAMSAMAKAPVTVMKTSGEGGAYGIALLALYTLDAEGSLSEFLNYIFKDAEKSVVFATEKEIEKFSKYIENYKLRLPAVKTACEIVK